MSNLVEHARRELNLIGEDTDTIQKTVAVVEAFAAAGHSGTSAEAMAAYLDDLLRFRPLSPITSEPAEWLDRSDISGYPIWQNVRDGRAMSHDGGKTYWLVDHPGDSDTAPVYTAADPQK